MKQRELYVPEAEDGVIGGLMIRPDLCEEVGSFLSAKDFGDEDRSMLFNLILSAHSKGVKPDPVTISDVCDFLPSGERTIFVASMIHSNVVSAANTIAYARHVLERSAARRLHELGQRIIELACTEGKVTAQIAEAQQSLFEMNVADDVPDVQHYKDMLSGVIQEMDDRLNGRLEIGLDFGLTELDHIVQGLRPGNLVIVAGKPGTGKTVLGTNLADKIASKEGKSALIFSLEMPGAELVKRALAAAGGVSKNWIDAGGASSDAHWASFTVAVNKLQNSDVRICDKGALTFSRICNIARFQHKAKPLHLIVVDYLTLIRPDRDDRYATRSQEIGSFTRGFKALAKELGLPIVVLSQFNRASEGRSAAESKPRMSDLRDSGEIEQDADIVILGHRGDDEYGQKGLTHWNVAKVRHASPRACYLQFEGQFQRFVDANPVDVQAYENSTAKPAPARGKSYSAGF